MAVELKVPSAGESVTQVQLGEWRKAAGDAVKQDEIVVELETEKASMDLPAPVSGRISKILKPQGSTANVGDVIALIEQGGDEAGSAAAKSDAGAKKPAPAVREAKSPNGQGTARAAGDGKPAGQAEGEAPRIMPAARRALLDSQMSAEQVKATGPGGRMLKEDVQRAAADAELEDGATHPGGASGDADRLEEAVPMSALRRRVAERLVRAQQTAALLTTFNEIDMGAVLQLREKHQEAFSAQYSVKLGFMSFFVKAAIDALKRTPQLNAEIRELPGPDGKVMPHVVYRDYYDIGVAVSGEKGLVVPIVRNAERLSFAQIEQAVADFGQRARTNKIQLDELVGGTFTISNGGVFGSLLSTPIVNPPQSGILGLHAIQDRPVVRHNQVVIRPMMYVALTYDHRIVDGREAVTFLKRIKEAIEDPARMFVEV